MATLDPSQLRKWTIAVSHGKSKNFFFRAAEWSIALFQRNLARDENGKLLAKGRTATHVIIKRHGEGLNGWFSMDERGGNVSPFNPRKGDHVTFYEIIPEIRCLVTPAGDLSGQAQADAMIGEPYDFPELIQFVINKIAPFGLKLRIDSKTGTVCSTAVASIVEAITDGSNAPSVFGRLILRDITPAHYCNLKTLTLIGDCHY